MKINIRISGKVCKDNSWYKIRTRQVFSCYLCNVHPAWSHGGYTLRTGHKGSPQDHDPSHTVVSMETSGKEDSSYSGSSSPYGAPCPCPSVGTSPCSASSFVDPHPEEWDAFRIIFKTYFSVKGKGLICLIHTGTCLKRFRWSMRMSGRVQRLSLMLPCWSCLQCGHLHASSGASWRMWKTAGYKKATSSSLHDKCFSADLRPFLQISIST